MRPCHIALACLLILAPFAAPAVADPITGYLQWRGPHQDGNLADADVPALAPAAQPLWTLDAPGRGTAVIGNYADGPRLFVLGYTGEGPDLLETLFCLDPLTGKEHWRKGYPDFISDIIYNRYSIGAPTIDPQTGNVFILTSPGLLVALDKDGNELWRVSMMESYGRLTFPNGRTGAPVVDGDRVIVNAITSNWGREGPARNRFYAFDKSNGQLIWSSDPGVGPPYLKDSSFSTPLLENRAGRRVFYAGLGDGNLVGVNALTGQPLWRFQMAAGGVNSSPVIYRAGTDASADDLVIQVHGKENIADTGRGYMIAIKADAALAQAASAATKDLPIEIKADAEAVAWRNDEVSQFTSSPLVVDDTVYISTAEGHLVAIDAAAGQTRWKLKVGPDQLHASPIYASGNIYIPFWHNGLVIVPHTPGSSEAPSFTEVKLEGDCIGSPALWNGMLFLHTTKKLYAFGEPTNPKGVPAEAETADTHDRQSPAKKPVSLGVQPAEVALRPGQAAALEVFALDETGSRTLIQTRDLPRWEPWVPPTARVHAELDGTIQGGVLAAGDTLSAGAFRVAWGGLHGEMRGRVLPSPPYAEDFESFDLVALDSGDQVHYAHPPLPWIGARMKWQVREAPGTGGLAGEGGEDVERVGSGNKVLAKTLDNVLFMRSMIFMGHPDDAGYTIAADVMSDGSRRGMGVIGVINQRYIIAIDGMKQQLEVSSNHDRIKIGVAFPAKPNTWYRIKSKVTVNQDGTGVVHGKAWEAGAEEPEQWTINAQVPHVHTQGSPGLYGFSPQSKYRVFIDNVVVEPNE